MPCRTVLNLHQVQIGFAGGYLRHFALIAVGFKHAYADFPALRRRPQIIARTCTVSLFHLRRIDIRHTDFVLCAVNIDNVQGVAVIDFRHRTFVAAPGFCRCLTVLRRSAPIRTFLHTRFVEYGDGGSHRFAVVPRITQST